MSNFRPSLGRIFNPADPEEHALHPVSRQLAAQPSVAISHYHFSNGWWGDQGDKPQCVAYAWTHWLEDGPVKHSGKAPCIDPGYLYAECQKIDGDSYPHDGTTTLAAAKTLTTLGYISGYHWAYSLDEVVQTILQLGPVVCGVNWYESMFYPDEAGLIEVSGNIAGGHEIKLDGANTVHELLRIKNSWGRSWGANGFACISFNDFQRLLSEDGDACLAVEIGVEQP
jgi:hypothetical protein